MSRWKRFANTVLVVGVLALTACTAPPTVAPTQQPQKVEPATPPPTSSNLAARLLPASALPTSVVILESSTGTESPAPEPSAASAPATSASRLTCLDAGDGTSVLRAEQNPVGGAMEILVDANSDVDQGWELIEWVQSYPPGAADRILDDLRSVVPHCAKNRGPQISVGKGPAVADDSVWLHIRYPFPNGSIADDATFVRVGQVLIMIEEKNAPTDEPALTARLTSMVTSAYATYRNTAQAGVPSSAMAGP